LKLMLLNNTICRHIVEGKSSAVLSASGAVFDLYRHHCFRHNVTITPLSEALLQLDAASIASATPATTCDAVLYNTALALMQGGGSGHAVAFTVLARCSHLQVSRGRFTQLRVAVEQHARQTSWRAHCACDEFNLLYSAVPSSIGCGCVSVAHTCAGWPTHSRACLFRSSVDGITQRGPARDAGQCACVFDRCNSNNSTSSAACNTPQATCYFLEVCHHAPRPSIHHPRKRAPACALTRFVHHTVCCHLPAAIIPTDVSAPPDYRSARCKASFGPVQFSSSSSPAATAVAAAAG
jgi:hypothetical protein